MLTVVVTMVSLTTVPAFALTESEVQDQVNAIGKEAVTGNVFCVVFMLHCLFEGVAENRQLYEQPRHQCRTHRRLYACGSNDRRPRHRRGEIFFPADGAVAEVAIRPVQVAEIPFEGRTHRRCEPQDYKQRHKQRQRLKNGGLGGMAFNSSLGRGGGFANSVIGKIATGSMSSTGSISGEGAADSLISYMGYAALGSNAEDIPSFSDVKIGGGHIFATETSSDHPEGIAMGMYHTDQYMPPDGEYTTVQTADGASWYKQYAADTVERKPYKTEDGSVAYRESIVKKLPKAPQRKDKI